MDKYNEPMVYWLPVLFSILLLFISLSFRRLEHRSMCGEADSSVEIFITKISSYWLVNMAPSNSGFYCSFLSTEFSFWLGQPHYAVLYFVGRRLSCFRYDLQESRYSLQLCAPILINLVAWCNQLSRNKMVSLSHLGLMKSWARAYLPFHEDLSFFADKLPLYYVNFGSVIQGMNEDDFMH